MKNTIFGSILLSAAVVISGCSSTAPSKSAGAKSSTASAMGAGTNLLSSARARDSYALGLYLGQGWKKNGMDVDPDLVGRGIADSFSTNATPLMSQPDAMNALNDLRNEVNMNRQKMQAEEQKEQAEAGQKNETAGETFLAENKSKTGVITLPDGLQYKILSEASGDMPAPEDIVTVNYRGTFVDGTEFDSSAKTGHPAQFPVNRVIPGWTEALEKMTVGSKWQLFIPSDLAYGASGRPPVVGPNQTLIFDVELLSITHPAPPAPRQPLTSDIIKVPSAEEMKKGAKIETIKASDLQKMQQEQSTNQ